MSLHSAAIRLALSERDAYRRCLCAAMDALHEQDEQIRALRNENRSRMSAPKDAALLFDVDYWRDPWSRIARAVVGLRERGSDARQQMTGTLRDELRMARQAFGGDDA